MSSKNRVESDDEPKALITQGKWGNLFIRIDDGMYRDIRGMINWWSPLNLIWDKWDRAEVLAQRELKKYKREIEQLSHTKEVTLNDG